MAIDLLQRYVARSAKYSRKPLKADIQAWLTKHNIPFDKKLLRPELLALAKANKPEPQYIIDDIAKEKEYYSATSAVSPRLEPHRTGVGTT